MANTKRGELGYWAVRLIISLVMLVIILIIISQANEQNMEFLDWLRGVL